MPSLGARPPERFFAVTDEKTASQGGPQCRSSGLNARPKASPADSVHPAHAPSSSPVGSHVCHLPARASTTRPQRLVKVSPTARKDDKCYNLQVVFSETGSEYQDYPGTVFLPERFEGPLFDELKHHFVVLNPLIEGAERNVDTKCYDPPVVFIETGSEYLGDLGTVFPHERFEGPMFEELKHHFLVISPLFLVQGAERNVRAATAPAWSGPSRSATRALVRIRDTRDGAGERSPLLLLPLSSTRSHKNSCVGDGRDGAGERPPLLLLPLSSTRSHGHTDCRHFYRDVFDIQTSAAACHAGPLHSRPCVRPKLSA